MSKLIPQAKNVLMDPGHLFIPGLFKPKTTAPCQGRKVELIPFSGTYGGVTYTGHCPQLSAAHQSVLFSAIANAMFNGEKVVGETALSALNQSHKAKLAATEAAERGGFITVSLSRRRLLLDAGMQDGKKEYALLKNLLYDMTLGSIEAETITGGVKRVASSHILSYSLKDEEISIALNWRLLHAMTNPGYTHIDLRERYALNATAKIIHARLCVVVDPGTKGYANGQGVKLDTLVAFIYPDDEMATPQAKAKRRKAMRGALLDLSHLPAWNVSQDKLDGEKYYISRDKEDQPVSTPLA